MSSFDALTSNPLILGLAVALGMFLFLAVLATLSVLVGGRGRLSAIRVDLGSYVLLFIFVVLVVIAAALTAQWLAASHAAFASTVFVAWLCGLVVARTTRRGSAMWPTSLVLSWASGVYVGFRPTESGPSRRHSTMRRPMRRGNRGIENRGREGCCLASRQLFKP